MKHKTKLKELWENEVPVGSKFFQKKVKCFVDCVGELCRDISINELKLSLIDIKGLSKEESKILNLLSLNEYVIATTKKDICKALGLCSTWTLITCLSSLQAYKIVKVDNYGRVRLIYLHPNMIEKWNKKQK